MMRSSEEEPSPSFTAVADLISLVKELQRFKSRELSKLLKENENSELLYATENGSTVQIDVDKFVRLLPLHLSAVLLSSERDEVSLRYLLSGLRLLYSFCDIAPRHPKLEQILLEDPSVSKQLLDLVFYILAACSAWKKGHHLSDQMVLLHSALVACSMYLLTGCISPQWNELVCVLQAHPKVDIFIDAAFGAVRRNINLLHIKISAEEQAVHSNLTPVAENAIYFCCQQCEASLQFLQQICQNISFQEQLLKNKELCAQGGVLRIAQATLQLNVAPMFKESLAVVAAVSRLKARALAILLNLCEAESASYLDEVASIPESFDLAKSVAVEVIALLKTLLSGDLKQLVEKSCKTYPMGLLQLNALRLADIFSDDSNFRSYITVYVIEVLAAILSIPYQQFLSSWCSSDLPLKEEDASWDYEPFTMAGWALNLSSRSDIIYGDEYELNFSPTDSAQAPYAYQRTSLLVKIIANLHCFVPKICKEQERNHFLHKFLDRLKMEWQDPPAGLPFPSQSWAFSSMSQKAAIVCKNLRSLLGHAESLIPSFLNEEDVQLLRVFFTQLQLLIGQIDHEVNRSLDQNTRGSSSPLHINAELEQDTTNINLREGMSESSALLGVDSPCIQGERVGEADGAMQDGHTLERKSSKSSPEALAETEEEVQNAETSGSDSSCTRENPVEKVGKCGTTNSSEHSCQEEKRSKSLDSEERKVKKRKRYLMNENQVRMIENALLEEPDLKKNPASIQSWADKLSLYGAEVTSSQLKNWLNNRKAKLARVSKDQSWVEENPIGTKQEGPIVQPSSNSSKGHIEHSPAPAKDQNQVSIFERTYSGADLIQNSDTILPENSTRLNSQNSCPAPNPNGTSLEVGQAVILTDVDGKEMAKGTVFQVEGEWLGCGLTDSGTFVVDIAEITSEKIVRIPSTSIGAGVTLEQPEIKIGSWKVIWPYNRIRSL